MTPGYRDSHASYDPRILWHGQESLDPASIPHDIER